MTEVKVEERKLRPIGQIVAANETANLLLEIGVQDPKKGSAMVLRKSIETLSPEQILQVKTLLQAGADNLAGELAALLQEMFAGNQGVATDQQTLTLPEAVQDELEIPSSFRERKK